MPNSPSIQVLQTPAETTRPGHVDMWISERIDSIGPLSGEPDWLNATERRRLRRYLHDIHRIRFVSRRWFLRNVLSRYMGIDARSIRIGTRTGGKLRSIDDPAIEFNASSAGDTCVVAVAHAPVGIDVIRPTTIGQPDVFAGRWLTSRERSWIDAVEDHRRREALASVMSRKEAVLKATGEGFSVSPHTVETLPDTDDGTVTVTTQPATAWFITDLDVPGPLIGAVATTLHAPMITSQTLTRIRPDASHAGVG